MMTEIHVVRAVRSIEGPLCSGRQPPLLSSETATTIVAITTRGHPARRRVIPWETDDCCLSGGRVAGSLFARALDCMATDETKGTIWLSWFVSSFCPPPVLDPYLPQANRCRLPRPNGGVDFV